MGERDFGLHQGMYADGFLVNLFQFAAQGLCRAVWSWRKAIRPGARVRQKRKKPVGDGIAEQNMALRVGEQDGVIRGSRSACQRAVFLTASACAGSGVGGLFWPEDGAGRRSQGNHATELPPELVADPAHGQQHFGPGGDRLQLLAQPADVDVHRPVVHVGIFAPDARQQRLPVKDAARWAASRDSRSNSLRERATVRPS